MVYNVWYIAYVVEYMVYSLYGCFQKQGLIWYVYSVQFIVHGVDYVVYDIWYMVCDPKSPDIPDCRTMVPTARPGTVFGTRVLTQRVFGPFG